MFNVKLKRCIASLMLIILIAGVLNPCNVIAAPASIAGFSEVVTDVLVKFYPDGSSTTSHTAWKLTINSGAPEYSIWANPNLTSSSVNSGFTSPGKSADVFQQKCYSKLSSDNVGTFEEFSKDINNSLSQTQGASTSLGLDSLSKRLALFLYARMNFDKIKGYTDIENISNTHYSDVLHKTLDLGHEESLQVRLDRLGMLGDADANNTKGTINSKDKAYSVRYMGALSLAWSTPTGTSMSWSPIASNQVFLANDYAAAICLSEYLDVYEETMVTIYNTNGWENNENCKNQLILAKSISDGFKEYIPLVDIIYNKKNSDAGNMSIKDMVEKADVSESSPSDVTMGTQLGVNYEAHTDDSTPIGQFYSVNSPVGIVSYERDKILADVEVNNIMDLNLRTLIEEQKSNNHLNLEDNYKLDNEFLAEQSSYANNMLIAIQSNDASKLSKYILDEHYEYVVLQIKENVNDTIYSKFIEYANDSAKGDDLLQLVVATPIIMNVLSNIASHTNSDEVDALDSAFASNKEGLKDLSETFTKEAGVTNEGVSSSMSSVTINKLIIEGMGYSATFVPMRTNLYSTDVIKSFSGDTEFYDFYKKYGFMRKALLIDTSSTSAVDYYTAGGVFTGKTRVCTLRDLLESGDSDVTLYIDSNFYNAADAIEEGNVLRTKDLTRKSSIYNSLAEFQPLWGKSTIFNNCNVTLSLVQTSDVLDAISEAVDETSKSDSIKIDADEFYDEMADVMSRRYDFNLNKLSDTVKMKDYVHSLAYANSQTNTVQYNDQLLKNDSYTSYADSIRNVLDEIDGSNFVNIASDEELRTTDDNLDSVVMTSTEIVDYMSMLTQYQQVKTDEDKGVETTTSYSKIASYTPMLSLSYVSCLYRSPLLYTLANTVENDNPVFMASDELCGISEANQWYRNSLINYALLKNLKGNAQVDYNYVVDLDCPIYMDIFGNILTEGGTVVIPAACNATLHAGSFKDNNFAVGLYTCYGKEYRIPVDTAGAYSVFYPYLVADLNVGEFVTNAITVNIEGESVRLDQINQYNTNVQSGVIDLYKTYVSNDGKVTRMNWMAMVKIINEVMRGAPIENIDKSEANLYTASTRNKAATNAAIKLESLINSLKGSMSNTLLTIPDFTRMDNMEVWVALLIKLVMVATCAVIIVAIYRDGVSGSLGLRTLFVSLTAIALSVSCIVVIPSVFQLTYYAANKFLLADEVTRILMVNEEKRQCGVEINMTNTSTVESTGDFSLQLDWITVPWYEELENILYESTLDNLQETKLKAYRESVIYNNTDVDLYNDGVYVSTDKLFDSVAIDYTFSPTTSGAKGLYLWSQDDQQTASFYSPYYVFLRVITSNINEYNQWRGAYGDTYVSYDEVNAAANDNSNIVLNNNSYTTKYVSGNRLKTVGLCYNYFTSDSFMEEDKDIMRLYQIYGSISSDKPEDFYHAMSARESYAFDRTLLFNEEDLKQFRSSTWFNSLTVNDIERRIEIMDNYARDFVARNNDLLNKVTDETFIKVMALNMAIKYNQLFGIPCANAIEIYNLDSSDLLRLCIVNADEAVMASPMSYARFVYNFSGEAGVYAGAVLTIIMWLGSFIKPLCTVLVFLSVFMSIFVFRVCLRKPSANLWGYLVTVSLLCATNILHALILKIGVSLPSFGLSTLGCLIFLIFGQVIYLLLLSYVTGVSLKDWSNLGLTEYEKEARLIKSKFKHEDTSAMLSGNVKHHEDNWDYYNDLVNQHRSRNVH